MALMIRLILAGLLAVPAFTHAAPLGNCSSEIGLAGRGDIVFCEPWESVSWWQTGYLKTASTTRPVAADATAVANATIVSTGCVSGSCLRVDMKQYQSGALAIHWPLKAANLAPDELHLRYYLKLGDNFSPQLCSAGGSGEGSGGKFPGLADVRVYPEDQCGNGGAFSDGKYCWSGRLKYRDCAGSGGADICTADTKGKNATTRLGWYWYLPPASGATNQVMGAFDNQSWGSADSPCSNTRGLGSDGSDSTSCGKGAAGFVNGEWYLIELYAKMNTPGQANGIARTWIDGVLKYEKTNVEYRIVGHENLHVRTIWLNVHAGGENVGPCSSTYVMLDQLVAATGGRVGPAGPSAIDQSPPAAPSGVRVLQ